MLVVFLAPGSLLAQAGRITGTVTGSSGGPLSGAQVIIVGSTLGAQTDGQGRFTIAGVQPGTHRVQAEHVGYATQEKSVTLTTGQATADFILAPAAVQLDAVVAIGYGTARTKDLTGAVSTVSGEEVLTKAAPTSAVSNALQGKAPGVQVTINSGVPGAGASVRVRGTNSISANSEPLYVIDGIPAVQGTSSQDPTYNPLNEINPNDIASIQILKDASSTAIYGSRGANGVILITTRRGTRNQDQLTLESSYGIQQITKTIHPLDAQQFATLVNEAYINSGRDARYCKAGLPGCEGETESVIWGAQSYDYPDLMVRNAAQQSHTLTLSGGDARTRYLISGNYLDQDGILVNSNFKRYGLRLNLDRMMSDRFRTGTSIGLARTGQNVSRTDNGGIGASANGILAAMNFDPSLAPKNEAGEWNQRAILGEQLENPLANTMEIVDTRNEWRGVGNIFGEYDLTSALRVRSTVGLNAHFWRNPYFAPRTIAPGAGSEGSASMNTGYDRTLTNENTLTYRRDLGGNALELLGGFSVQTYSSESSSSHAEGFPSDELQWNNLGAGSGFRSVGTGYSDWALLSYLGRVNYNVSDKYLFTATARRDGSSRFGANNKWAVFPSAAFAWRAIDEGFMQNQSLFSDLKLRLSYGVTGNQAVSQYQSLARLSTQFVGIGVNNEEVTLVPSGSAPNPDLKWETTREFNAGVDAGFFDNRVTLSLDAYHKKTDDLLLWVNLPRTSGYNNQLQNLGSVQNNGVELSLSTVNVERESFSWRSTLNLSANRNEVLDLGGVDHVFPGGSRYGWFLDGGQSHIVQVGEPLGSIYGYQTLGLWQEGDACDLEDAAQCTPGEYHMADTNDDGKIDAADRTILGYAEPKFFGGFSNALTAGPFSLDAFFNFSYGNDVANVSRVFTELATGFLNESERVLDRWTPENTNAEIPRANNARPRRLYGALVENGSFLRLSTLTLGYRLPESLITGVSNARLYLTGQNLFVLSDYSGFDPEVNSVGGDARLSGVDSGAYPRARVWNLGVSVTF